MEEEAAAANGRVADLTSYIPQSVLIVESILSSLPLALTKQEREAGVQRTAPASSSERCSRTERRCNIRGLVGFMHVATAYSSPVILS